ncbi:MAG: AraC family transcriptional regulator, partial [Prevotella sp.]|nr:AraC family transcriptional regulator [Prevotella sp.]
YRSGFSDPKYFSKCFKKLTGMTPTEFQNPQ